MRVCGLKSSMPITFNARKTRQPFVVDNGMGSPDEELLDLDSPSCSPTANRIHGDYEFVTDAGEKRLRRTCQVLCDRLDVYRLLDLHGLSGGLNELQVSVRFPDDEVAPIHVATLLADADFARLLLRLGAQRDRKTARGLTPMDIALREDRGGSHEAVRQMLVANP